MEAGYRVARTAGIALNKKTASLTKSGFYPEFISEPFIL
jgi:hypothetical protein